MSQWLTASQCRDAGARGVRVYWYQQSTTMALGKRSVEILQCCAANPRKLTRIMAGAYADRHSPVGV
jgi:hypothetical protein